MEENKSEVSKDSINYRKDKIINYFLTNKNLLIYLILLILVVFAYDVRTNNFNLLKDSTTGDFTPIDIDSYLYLRYAQQVIDHGKVLAHDSLRYYPYGYETSGETIFVSYFIAYLYKFLHFFNSNITLNYTDIIYPALTSAIGLIFFFLLVRRLFDYKIALLSSFLLAVIPSFVYRTMSPDKEALANMLMFMALYFFIVAYQSDNLKKSISLGILAGISTGLMALSWGGVQFIFLTIGLFYIIMVALNKFELNKFLAYCSWMIAMFFIAISLSGRYTINGILYSFTTEVVLAGFLAGLIYYIVYERDLLKIKNKLKRYPKGILSVLITGVIGLVFVILLYGPSFISNLLNEQYINLIQPFGRTRWALTVAESHQPYLVDWASNLGWKYIWVFIIGSVILFYELIKSLNKHIWKFTVLYFLFIMGITFSRYSSDSVFNGTSSTAQLVYFGSIIIFILVLLIVYLYSYYVNGGLFEKFNNLDDHLIFILLWSFLMIIAARSAIRLLSVISPVTVIIVSFFVFWLYGKSKSSRNIYRVSSYVLLFLILLLPVALSSTTFAFGIFDKGIIPKFTKSTIDTSRNLGPSYGNQWQQAMKWVRENTPKESVIAHWWDYGYWVQYGGQRATLSDGGNALRAINHFIGRHVLTAQSEEEALEFLKSRGANYLLMIDDEIGKYPAFSSIGADADYDRYSWISTYVLDPNKQEGRDTSYYVYRGGSALDDNFEYQGKIFPANNAGIGAFLVPIKNEQDILSLGQPTALLFYNNQQFNVPLKCLYVDNKLLEFQGDGLDGCLVIIPAFLNDNQANVIGAALYLSPDVKKSLFAQLYLLDKKTKNFELVYKDDLPIAIYNGNIIGPIKIWKVNPPKNIKINPVYQGTDLPDPRVDIVRR